MTVQFNPPALGDGKRMSDLLADWIAKTAWMPQVHSADQAAGFEDWLCKVADVTVLRRATDFVGFYAFQNSTLQAFYLTKNWRGQGIGTRVMQKMQQDHDLISLWTFQENHSAQQFYTGHGFVEVDRTDGAGNDEKLPDIKYEWRQTP